MHRLLAVQVIDADAPDHDDHTDLFDRVLRVRNALGKSRKVVRGSGERGVQGPQFAGGIGSASF